MPSGSKRLRYEASPFVTLLQAVAVLAVLADGSMALAQSTLLPQPIQTEAPREPSAKRAAALDALLHQLKDSKDATEAGEFVSEIWRLWHETDNPDVELLMERAAASMPSRNFGLARMLLDEVVEIAPRYAEGWNQRATLLFIMGDHGQSLADIEKVLELEPRHFGALAGRGHIHLAAERWQEAMAAFRAALAINPFLRERNRMIPLLEQRLGAGKP